jgi:NADH-quinone oxidoreductase subunit F
VSGTSKNPGVFEVEYGSHHLRDVIYGEQYGGGIVNGNAIKAYIPGGASAPWFFEEHLDSAPEKGTVDRAGSLCSAPGPSS